MTTRRSDAHETEVRAPRADGEGASQRNPVGGHTGIAGRLAGPRSLAEAEEQYIAARNAWTAAMRAAASGKPAEMATLAIAQEAYEEAAAERERWLKGGRSAIPIEPDNGHRPLDAIVGQELARRQVRERESATPEPRGLGRFVRRIRGR